MTIKKYTSLNRFAWGGKPYFIIFILVKNFNTILRR